VVFSFDFLELNCNDFLNVVACEESNDKGNKLVGIIKYVSDDFIKKLSVSCVFVCDVIAEK
jgi:hypothetical protein